MQKLRQFILALMIPMIYSLGLQAQNTITDIVVNSPDHTILETAVLAAGLEGTLAGPGPLTVFAPTDAAFNALPAGALDAVLADNDLLTSILTYHAVSGDVRSTALMDGMVVTTLNGKDITVTINSNGVFINNAQVTMADVPADNGVVHVIDAVLFPPSNTITDIVVNSPDHTILETAVLAAGLEGTLAGPGPFTVFAPTDAAFNALPAGALDAVLADNDLLTSILTYHVVSGDVRSTALMDGMVVTTLNGKDITVTINMNGVFINDAQVTVADVPADNGVVHVIDAVLFPPSNTITDIVVASPDHNILETAVLAAGLEGTLAGPGPFTVFAPTDAAFNALPAGALDAVLADKDVLTNLLTYHVVSGYVRSTELMDGMVVTTLNGRDITVTINMDGVFINDAQVTLADIPADNGVVHIIDAVLLPPSNTITDIVVASPVHNTLETAVLAAGLEGTLAGPGPFTVFAPTDDAFAALPDGVLDAILADKDLLTFLLTYHVTAANALSTDLTDGMTITMLNGQDVDVTINTDGIFINDSQVILADIEADNGVVHVIDAVLEPSTNTIYDIIVESDVHNTLEIAVDAAGLDETLDEGGPFTVFAPTDDAFALLGTDLLDGLLADPDGLLTSVLLQHVVSGEARSGDLSNGQMITTLLGESVTVTIDNGNVFINDAQVIVADVEADNGVVHVIDAVLLPPPPTVVDVIVGSPLHNTLELAVGAAGLIPTLQGEGPFTVFAPTDAAFNLLPAGTVDALLADPMGALTDVLLYHVLGADVRSTDLTDGQMATTINGKDVTVTINTDGVFINDAQVVLADIVTGNGVVHIIDAVLIPPTTTVADVVINSPDHNTLEAALGAAGLVETLQGEGPFTVFAPTDAAFGALPAGTVDALLADPTGDLTTVLLYHVLGADVRSTDLSDGQTATTLNSQDITVTINTDGVFINDAKVSTADIVTDNGVVHVLDGVLIPSLSSTSDIELATFNVFPNPTSDFIQIEFNDMDTKDGQIRLIDNAGKVVKTVRGNDINSSINVSDISSGIYLLEFRNTDSRSYKKLIIE